MSGCLRSLAIVACVGCLAGCAGGSSLDAARTHAEAAVVAGDWNRATEILLETEALGPDLIELVERLVTERIVLAVPTENQLMDWLDDRNRMDLLRAVLTQSTVEIPAGWALIGTEEGRLDEQPAHDVWLTGFLIDRHEVTNLEFEPFARSSERWPLHWGGRQSPAQIARHPVLGISWADAASFCEWSGGRLPTEAEWERACAGTDRRAYPWGGRWDDTRVHVSLLPLDDPDEALRFLLPDEGTPIAPQPVGSPAGGATPEGVCNLGDNASEWIADWYASHAYETLPAIDPIATEPEWSHVVRGGAWLFRSGDLEAAQEMSRCTSRNASHAIADVRMGFRCVHEP